MASSNPGKYRLLAVDDDKDSTELVVRNALRCGYECFSVYDARSLREIIPHWRPHVITLDLCLPDVKRFETISMLDAVRFSGDLIIISGQPDWYRREAADFAQRRTEGDGGSPQTASDRRVAQRAQQHQDEPSPVATGPIPLPPPGRPLLPQALTGFDGIAT